MHTQSLDISQIKVNRSNAFNVLNFIFSFFLLSSGWPIALEYSITSSSLTCSIDSQYCLRSWGSTPALTWDFREDLVRLVSLPHTLESNGLELENLKEQSKMIIIRGEWKFVLQAQTVVWT